MVLVGCAFIVVAPVFLPVESDQTDSTVRIMSCKTIVRDLADLLSISFNFKAPNKEQVIEKDRKALEVCSFANTVINKQNGIIMKHMEKILKTSTLPIDDALAPTPGSAPAPVSVPARASAPVFTNAIKTFASIVKTTQSIIVKHSDHDVIVTSRDEMMRKN